MSQFTQSAFLVQGKIDSYMNQLQLPAHISNKNESSLQGSRMYKHHLIQQIKHMTHDAHAGRRQEEKIKNHLYNLEFEEAQAATHCSFRHFYHLHNNSSNKKSTDYPQLCDWNSGFQVPQQSLPNQKRLGQLTPQKDIKRFTFLNTARYHSSLLSPSNKKEKLQLSPIVVKFNAKILSQNLQRSRQKFVRKLKEDPYLAHYHSLNLLYEKRKRQEQHQQPREVQRHEIKFEGIQTYHPPNQRMNGLLRMIKRESPFKVRPRKAVNPENLTTTRLL